MATGSYFFSKAKYVLPSVGKMHENSAYFVPFPFSPMHLSGVFANITLLIVMLYFARSPDVCTSSFSVAIY